VSKRAPAPKSRPSAQAAARAKQRRRRERWRMPVLIGSLALAVVAIAAIALTVADQSKPAKNAGANVVEVADSVTVKGAALPALPDDSSKLPDPAVGQPAPILEGVDIQGDAVTVPQSGPAVIAFVAHWCPHCQREVPVIMDLRKTGQWPSNVALAGVSTAVAQERDNYPASTWLRTEGWDAPVLVDTKGQTASKAFGLTGFPFLVWIDANGKVVLRTSGELSEGQLAGMLDQLSRGETPVKQTA